MTTTIEIKTKKEAEILKTIEQYEKDGWKLVSKTKSGNFDPMKGLLFSVPTWSLTFSKPDAKTDGNSSSAINELKKAKELLDSGIISQDEFDSIKKKLLNGLNI